MSGIVFRPWWPLLALATGCGFGLEEFTDTGDGDKAFSDGWGNDALDDGPDTDDGEPDSDDDGSGDESDGGPEEPPPDDGGEADDDAPPASTLSISSVSPQHGSNLGGTIISIVGGPFGPGAVVKVAGASVPVAANLGDELRVETPAFDGEGWASISVVQPDGAVGEVTDGFHFWEDGTGLTGATGYYQWIEPVGGYWSGGSAPAGWGAATVHFLVPNEFRWWNWITPSMENCTDPDTYSYPGELLVYDFEESALAIKNETGAHTVLNYDSSALGFVKSELARSDFKLGQSYEMQPFEGPEAPPGSLPGFIETPATFNVYNPAISGTTVPYINRNQTITWAPGGADYVWIELALLDSTATMVQQSIVCIAVDDGSFTVPSSEWSSWPTDRQVNLGVSKVVESGTIMPHNNSESRIAAFYTVLGAGFSQ